MNKQEFIAFKAGCAEVAQLKNFSIAHNVVKHANGEMASSDGYKISGVPMVFHELFEKYVNENSAVILKALQDLAVVEEEARKVQLLAELDALRAELG